MKIQRRHSTRPFIHWQWKSSNGIGLCPWNCLFEYKDRMQQVFCFSKIGNVFVNITVMPKINTLLYYFLPFVCQSLLIFRRYHQRSQFVSATFPFQPTTNQLLVKLIYQSWLEVLLLQVWLVFVWFFVGMIQGHMAQMMDLKMKNILWKLIL